MSVRIRMKRFGRRHRPFYRVCAVDTRRPRDGRVLEELGTYDPMVPNTDARAVLDGQRIKYWLSVGAQPSDKVKVLIKKYGAEGTHLAKQQFALDELAQSRRRAEPVVVAADEPAESAEAVAVAEPVAEAVAEPVAEAPAEAPPEPPAPEEKPE